MGNAEFRRIAYDVCTERYAWRCNRREHQALL
jgi:hypothetical protein